MLWFQWGIWAHHRIMTTTFMMVTYDWIILRSCSLKLDWDCFKHGGKNGPCQLIKYGRCGSDGGRYMFPDWPGKFKFLFIGPNNLTKSPYRRIGWLGIVRDDVLLDWQGQVSSGQKAHDKSIYDLRLFIFIICIYLSFGSLKQGYIEEEKNKMI